METLKEQIRKYFFWKWLKWNLLNIFYYFSNYAHSSCKSDKGTSIFPRFFHIVRTKKEGDKVVNAVVCSLCYLALCRPDGTHGDSGELSSLCTTSYSMTSLLTHTVAHSTYQAFLSLIFRPKTNNQPIKKFLSLVISWVKVIKNWKSF